MTVAIRPGEYGGVASNSAPDQPNALGSWDTLHPARSWAGESTADQKPVNQIESELMTHFTENAPYPDTDAVLAEFFEELRQSV